MDSRRLSPLGRAVPPPERYDPSLLYPIERGPLRALIGCTGPPPFGGADLWTAYEVTWLDRAARPAVAILEMRVPASSPAIVESKSLKLYLGSLANEAFTSTSDVEARIASDVGAACGTEIEASLVGTTAFAARGVAELAGESLDGEAIASSAAAELVSSGDECVEETLRTSLFRALCPVTGQPDHADVAVRYRGRAIARASLLGYLVSFRTHAAFHEQCVERMFLDIAERARPQALTVEARFSRRGGIAIAPFRSTFEAPPRTLVPTPRQ